jgi:hypothetical protein
MQLCEAASVGDTAEVARLADRKADVNAKIRATTLSRVRTSSPYIPGIKVRGPSHAALLGGLHSRAGPGATQQTVLRSRFRAVCGMYMCACVQPAWTTALHLAAAGGHSETVIELFRLGARVTAVDAVRACWSGPADHDLVGARACAKGGLTALHEAAANGWATLIEELVLQGASLTTRDRVSLSMHSRFDH